MFELFLGLLKQILVSKPEKPIDFLIEKLQNPSCKYKVKAKVEDLILAHYHLVKRFILIGAPGSEKKEYCKKLREAFGINIIETGTLLKKEIQKQTDNGIKIQKAFDDKRYGKCAPKSCLLRLIIKGKRDLMSRLYCPPKSVSK